MPGLDDHERDELLGASHVGILGVAAAPGSPPLVTPVWYVHEDGQILLVTGRGSRKARLLRAAGVATFVVHDDAVPRHVALEGDVAISEPDEAVRRRIAERYVPPGMLDGYLAATAGADMVLVRLMPRTWRTVDLTKSPG